jgi:predicted CoA-binding protein
MRHLTRDEILIRRLLRSARTIAVVGASPRRSHPSATAIEHLRSVGFDVIPVRGDRAPVLGVASRGRLADIASAVDVVLVFGRGDPRLVDEAAGRGVEAIWLAPGASLTAEGEQRAEVAQVAVVRERDIVAELRHGRREAGEPRKLGVRLRRRKAHFEDDRKRRPAGGYVEAGGGGRKGGGGGGRGLVDEKKMLRGRPSPRQGPMKRRRIA